MTGARRALRPRTLADLIATGQDSTCAQPNRTAPMPTPEPAAFHLARFNAIRAYQAQQGPEPSRCLRELRSAR
jgi:hypothetical protein